MKRILTFILLVFLCMDFSACKNHIKIDFNTGDSVKFSNGEIESAMDAVLKKFEDFEGCHLRRLWYDEDRSDREIQGYWKFMDSIVQGENVIILFSDFYADSSAAAGGFNQNFSYTDYMWILIREKKSDNWIVDDWGY